MTTKAASDRGREASDGICEIEVVGARDRSFKVGVRSNRSSDDGVVVIRGTGATSGNRKEGTLRVEKHEGDANMYLSA